jgi:hypothetical protein
MFYKMGRVVSSGLHAVVANPVTDHPSGGKPFSSACVY